MSQTLEAFANKKNFRIVITKIVTTERRYRKSNIQREVEWRIRFYPPFLLRWFRVHKGNEIVDIRMFTGKTYKETREKLLECIRGGVLTYSNEHDRAVGMDPKIRVPKDIR